MGPLHRDFISPPGPCSLAPATPASGATPISGLLPLLFLLFWNILPRISAGLPHSSVGLKVSLLRERPPQHFLSTFP